MDGPAQRDRPPAVARVVRAHKDYGLLTLLLTDEVPGLQVETPDGQGFIDVPYLPGAFMVQLG